MQIYLKFAAIVALFFTFVFAPARYLSAKGGEGYHFEVYNTTEDTIVKLLASEDGKHYHPFDLGRRGLPAGKRMTLTWDEKTDTSGCEWFIKAVFDDDSETPAKKFDFCEEGLEIEF
ncbi:MAG TPA: hypothetical protein VGM62_12515 [Chthoniobacterales bacterium]|jgi:hypothetical protein